MKIFLSWSGSESKQLASIFKEWLPNVLQYVNPYMSAQDIALGERWNANISETLHECTFGLIFVTPTNINAPWINYEAGALSKTIDSKVVPILFKANVMILNEGPLKQFQSAKDLSKESIFSLLESINNSYTGFSLDDLRLQKSFEMWWEELESRVNSIEREERSVHDTESNAPSDSEMLNVIYNKLSEQEKILKNTRNNIIHKQDRRISSRAIHDIESGVKALELCLEKFIEMDNEVETLGYLENNTNNLKKALFYLKRNFMTSDYKEELVLEINNKKIKDTF